MSLEHSQLRAHIIGQFTDFKSFTFDGEAVDASSAQCTRFGVDTEHGMDASESVLPLGFTVLDIFVLFRLFARTVPPENISE